MMDDVKGKLTSFLHFSFTQQIISSIPLDIPQSKNFFEESYRLLKPWTENVIPELLKDKIKERFTSAEIFTEELFKSFLLFLLTDENIQALGTPENLEAMQSQLKNTYFPMLKKHYVRLINFLFFIEIPPQLLEHFFYVKKHDNQFYVSSYNEELLNKY